MVLRNLLFSALKMAARNPVVQKQAAKAAETALNASKPSIMSASRKAGEMVQAGVNELQQGVKKFKAEHKGDEATSCADEEQSPPQKQKKNITPPDTPKISH